MSSRLLILALTVVAVVVGGVNLSLTAPDAVRAAHSQLDGQLARVAKALPGALDGAAAASLGLVSDVAASADAQAAIAGAAAPDQALLDKVLQAADATATKRGDREVRHLAVVATASGAAVFRQGADTQFGADSGVPLVKDALAGTRGTAVAAVDGTLYRVAAAPVGGAGSVGAIALGFPVDDAFVGSLRERLGVDVTVLQDGKVLATSLGAEDRGLLPAAAAGAGEGTAFGFGELPEETFSLFGLVKLPLFGESTAARARTVAVPGLEGAEVVLSAPSAAALVPVSDGQKTTVLLSGVILVVGLLFAGLSRGKGAGPDEEDLAGLADTAERAASGDATARAAEFLPGDLGRIARAVNKLAARTRQPAAPTVAAVPTPEPTGEFANRFPFGETAATQAAEPAAAEPAFVAAAREPTPGP